MAILKKKQSAQEQALAIKNIARIMISNPAGVDEAVLEEALLQKGFTRAQVAAVVGEMISANEIEREAPK